MACPPPPESLGALLLTGGLSRRMGTDKTAIRIDGEAIAARLARLLLTVAAPCVEVGPGRAGLPSVREESPGEGPLVAIAAGAGELRRRGHLGPALVVAGDLPLLREGLLALLAHWPGDESVLPLVDGHTQPLLARWSARDLDEACAAVAAGERSLRRLPDRARATILDESAWSAVASPAEFADIDTPESLAALGLGPRIRLP